MDKQNNECINSDLTSEPLVQHSENPYLALFYTSILSTKPGKWFNDEVINGFGILLQTHFQNPTRDDFLIYSPYVYPAMFDAEGKYKFDNIKAYKAFAEPNLFGKVAYMPVNLKNEHWVLVEIDTRFFPSVTLTYYDPMVSYGEEEFLSSEVEFNVQRLVEDLSKLG